MNYSDSDTNTILVVFPFANLIVVVFPSANPILVFEVFPSAKKFPKSLIYHQALCIVVDHKGIYFGTGILKTIIYHQDLCTVADWRWVEKSLGSQKIRVGFWRIAMLDFVENSWEMSVLDHTLELLLDHTLELLLEKVISVEIEK